MKQTRHLMKTALLAGLCTLWLGCGISAQKTTTVAADITTACQSDNDCKGDRICVQSQCVAPDAAASTTTITTNTVAGLSCWDLNGNGIQDAVEDVNADGKWDALDCQGAAGTGGISGLACWDLNGNGVQDAIEDINGDDKWDALDCQGAAGTGGTFGLACWDLNGNGIQDAIEDINGDGKWDAFDCQGSSTGGITAAATPPETQIIVGPPSAVSNGNATLTFAGIDDVAVAFFQCRLNSALFAACTSPQSYTALTDGTVLFEVRAVDNAGNVDPSPAQWVWSIDSGAFGPKWQLPDTGQSLCYGASAAITCPASGAAYFGQDAQYGTNVLVFTDNGDGTITDNVTNLMWQKQDDNHGRQWSEAIEYCGRLIVGGYEDWRLPNRHELQSIVDYGSYNPAIDTTYFPGTASNYYWSSSSNALSPNFAWYVHFSNGDVNYYGKTSYYYARCVRP